MAPTTSSIFNENNSFVPYTTIRPPTAPINIAAKGDGAKGSAVTAEPLLPSPFAAILIGAVGGLIVVYGTKLLFSLKIDDVVGAIPAHLFAGIWGTLIVPATNSGANFSTQLIGVLSVNIFVFIVAYIVFSAIKATIGLRLSKEGETKGTDVTETGVIAYAIRD